MADVTTNIVSNIALRSPQFKYAEIPVSGVASAKCSIEIDGIVRYNLIKNVKKNTTVNFDISELARDYLNIEYRTDFIPITIDIKTTITTYSGFNATGSLVATVVFDDVGFEAYGTYIDGSNPTLPNNTILISKSVTNTIINRVTQEGGVLESPQCLAPLGVNFNEASSANRVTLLYPDGSLQEPYGGIVPTMVNNIAGAQVFGRSAVSIPNYPDSVIARINCTKYGNGNEITFINKFGAQQVLFFFLKKNKVLSRSNEGYKSNTINYPSTNNPATYDILNAPNKVFNTQAKQMHKLSSGYYPETLNEYFEQLLLSEYVWLKLESSTVRIPVKVKTSTMDFKTSVNDRLVEYTIEFEEAFDYINNIR